MKQTHILFSLLLFLGSCINQKEVGNLEGTILSINTDDKSIITDSPALTNIRFVKLETKDECLLEDVNKVIPFEDKLYILSSPGNGNVYIFDNKGKFIRKLNKGEGPENIIYPTDISLNANKRSLFVLDFYRNIKEYDLEGNFLRKISMQEPFFALEAIGNDFLLFDSGSRSKADYYVRYLTETSENKDFFQKPVKSKFFASSNFFTPISDDKVLVSCLFSDTIFLATSTEKELFPYIILDFQDKGANTPQRLNEISNVGEYLKKAKQQKYIPGPSDLSIINDNLFFTLNGEKFYFARYDTKKDKITLHTKLMEGLPNIYKSTGRTGKEVIYAMDMPWLIEYLNENQEIKSDVINQLRTECKDENDNPVVFFGS